MTESINGLPDKDRLSRRSLLEWLGGGTVMMLGGSLLSACLDREPKARPRSAAGPGDGGLSPVDASVQDRAALADGRGVDRGADSGEAAGISFAPGDPGRSIYQGFTEYTVDTQDVEAILRDWKLTVYGLVDRPQIFTFADMLELSRLDALADFHCVTGWSVLDVPWNGVHLSTLLDVAGRRPEATHVTFHTVGERYNGSLPLDVALEPKTLLAYGVADATLPLAHGFPLRLVVPRLWAYKSSKYVTAVELRDQADPGYWVQAGYPYDAEVPSSKLREGRY